MSSTRQTSDERRAALVEAALVAFARSGLHGTAVSTVTEAVGITQPYAFSLFGTKKGLFLAAVEHCFDRVSETFEKAAAGVPKRKRLKAMGSAYTELLSDRTVLQMQMQCFAACGDDEIRAVVRSRLERLFELIQDLAGVSAEKAREFLAAGMMCNLAATVDLPLLLPGDLAGPDCPSIP
ncbi:TetR/AcrR family transcriptional regulator [Actinopolymorpha alba]|uniref:TetR/AcrR family transcriptional regulator n=1 Tax=Actinopolymorpha alba TaxID=533267 RepID=UPI00036DB7B3|nr:TetR family transcriptional regulator [Actinopolymorpha alba]